MFEATIKLYSFYEETVCGDTFSDLQGKVDKILKEMSQKMEYQDEEGIVYYKNDGEIIYNKNFYIDKNGKITG